MTSTISPVRGLTKHTPGPWRTGHYVRDDHTCNCRYIFGNDDRMGAVAEVYVTEDDDVDPSDNPPPEEAKANMHLIAAAPELLAAANLAMEGIEVLDNLIASIEKHGNYSVESTLGFLNQARCARLRLTDAISKAEQPR